MNSTDYNTQAEAFLQKHGIKFRATLSDSKVAPWADEPMRQPRHHYRVTLSKGAVLPDMHANHVTRQNRGKMLGRIPKRLTFDFWGSAMDARNNIQTVSAYDVLACISSDVHCPETFVDYCSEFGESEDSIKALQTFRRVSAFAKRLREFFTEQELQDLNEIQ